MSLFFVQQYNTALTKSAHLPFRDKLNKELQLVYNTKNEPLKCFGKTSVVYKITNGESFYALKCYTTGINFRWEYLLKVRQMLQTSEKDWIIPFDIYENVLTVENDENYPIACNILLMPWVEGDNLKNQVEYFCSRPHLYAGLNSLSHSLIELANQQIGQPFSHGDISPENIMVTPTGKMKLIDHDSFTFDGWENSTGQGGWTFAYQHPFRDPRKPDPDADQFSFLVLATSLKAIELNPGLFRQFNSSKGLLFTIDDFKDPDNSNLITEIRKIKNHHLQQLLGLLVDSLQQKSSSLPGLLQVLNHSTHRQSEQPDNRPAENLPVVAETPGYQIQDTTAPTVVPVIHTSDPDKDVIKEKQGFDMIEEQAATLQKTGLEGEGWLKEVHRQNEIELIEKQKRETQLAQSELNALLQPANQEEHAENPSMTGLHKEKTGLGYQQQRKKIRAGVIIALTSVLVIVLGIKLLFPGTRLVKPVDYKNLVTRPPEETNENSNQGKAQAEKANPANTGEIGITSSNQTGRKEVESPGSEGSQYQPEVLNGKAGQQMNPGNTADQHQINSGKQPASKMKGKKVNPGKKYNNNTVTFRKTGF
jgi:hypothetical protein